MAEDKSKTVIVKARAKAFLTSKPEEEEPLAVTGTAQKKSVTRQQKSMPSAAEIAASIRKGEASKNNEGISKETAADTKKSAAAVVKPEPMFNGKESFYRKNKLLEGGRLKKIPACKMAEPMKRPADDTLIIAGKVTAASKRIQTPAAAEKTAAVKKEEVRVVEPAAAKAEPKKAETKPAAKKAEPKKAEAIVQNTYIQYQNETYNEAELVAAAEKIWTKDMKKKAADLKSLELYIKPQERMAYCVFNKKETGSFAI